MKAIILSAGRGSRLLPMTEARPKCLLPVRSTTLLGYQLDTLEMAGIRDVTVVTGFLPALVEKEIGSRRGPLKASAFFNPFFQVADNLASCWMVREKMDADFLLINGDTLFSHDLICKVIEAPRSDISVTIDQKSAYDEDDMKVTLRGSRLAAIGKRLPLSETDAESIGVLRFTGEGPGLFSSKLDQMMRTQDGVTAWFLKAVDAIASAGIEVDTCLIKGHAWAEVDTMADFNALGAKGF